MQFAFLCQCNLYNNVNRYQKNHTIIYDYNNRMQSLPLSDHFLRESILQGTGDPKVLNSLLMMSQRR